MLFEGLLYLACSRSPPMSQLFAVSRQSVRSLGIPNDIADDIGKIREYLKQRTCDEHIKLSGDDNGWREAGQQFLCRLVGEEYGGVPLGLKVL